MDGQTGVLLVTAGVAGGLINALAGGATLITFPAMLAAGLPPVIANASNAVAISPGHLIAALADRGKLPPPSLRAMVFVIVALLGGTVGAVVLLLLPERLFTLPVPALIAFATLLFAVAPQIQAWSVRRQKAALSSTGSSSAVLGLACVYGGFFGAGLGVILTAVLSISEPNDIRAIKALKNLLATCVACSATLIFIMQGAVRWPETGAMLVGAMVGGYAGGHLIRILPGHIIRQFVIVAGAVMTVIYAARYWL
ncbi:sulfite exporter TauE/SafE family protein [Bradyrhizobium sp. ISRA443]|uniref:sulfite exporter TauE/SafE family protein n=1 Tax=unclassified Bradyrhizobium TaxID=2631580 RepID=UPI002478E093|nr:MULTISPECIES: sulfite exporter TauE/SafE family protein [unclassified Bradyrhizobium]WGR91818.1 sulfite exporter TauE/SafE family protein [Bradyrhizobium sp. ISRA435]WGS02185.1 sulfite exporter TauE/SafE family protein [Bradyrhizobium sp. ISRA436]WGS09070.1 sulfite exporter TauE/SafE family protein [Bradyrhizobium sp. ISRA437]WGS15959.1 sulfite exporter TauE/SafE family protein [Bradyrhizobium sp. ISRA443]